jgi:cob(I)alamin adenosyltransferase
MVKLNRIYTRGGDQGETSLGDGTRLAKHHVRVVAYGTVDEANATIGLARMVASADTEAILARIQNDLFDLGADLCTPETGKKAEGALRITPAQVERLENEIDSLNEQLEPLTSFILPGGKDCAAYLHLARTVTRRAERLMTTLALEEPVNTAALQYINRLSDHLFVLARAVNDNGASDILWQPGKHGGEKKDDGPGSG